MSKQLLSFIECASSLCLHTQLLSDTLTTQQYTLIVYLKAPYYIIWTQGHDQVCDLPQIKQEVDTKLWHLESQLSPILSVVKWASLSIFWGSAGQGIALREQFCSVYAMKGVWSLLTNLLFHGQNKSLWANICTKVSQMYVEFISIPHLPYKHVYLRPLHIIGLRFVASMPFM